MSDKKVRCRARVRVLLEIELTDAWGGDCPLEQVYKQARDAAEGCVRQGLVINGTTTNVINDKSKSHARIISVTPEAIITDERSPPMSDPLTALLDRIELLEKKATAGPWSREDIGVFGSDSHGAPTAYVGQIADEHDDDGALIVALRNSAQALLRAARFGVEARKFISHVHGCAYLCEGGMKCHASHACDCGYEALLLELALLAKMTEEG